MVTMGFLSRHMVFLIYTSIIEMLHEGNRSIRNVLHQLHLTGG